MLVLEIIGKGLVRVEYEPIGGQLGLYGMGVRGLAKLQGLQGCVRLIWDVRVVWKAYGRYSGDVGVQGVTGVLRLGMQGDTVGYRGNSVSFEGS